MPVTIEAANVAKKLERLGISASILVGLSGTSKAQLSRFFNGQVRLPAGEIEKLNDAIGVLEKLFEAFHPFRPDLRDGDICGPLIQDFSKGLLTVKVEDSLELIRGNKFVADVRSALEKGTKNGN
jgi:hypothetical protein